MLRAVKGKKIKIETSSPDIVFPQFDVFKTSESGLILQKIKKK